MARRNNYLFVVLLLSIGVLIGAILLNGGSSGTPLSPHGGADPNGAPAAVPDTATGTVPDRDPARAAVETPDDATRRAVDTPTALAARIALRGRLVGDGGTPAADVPLRWRERRDFDLPGEDRDGGEDARTAADGTFAIDVPRGRRGSLRIDRAANLLFSQSDRRRVEVAAYEEAGDLGDLEVTAAASIVGRVVDEAGQPLPAARVRANPDAFVLWMPGEGQAVDGEGRFELRGLEPGAHRVGAEAPGFVPVTLAVDLERGATAREMLLKLDRGASIAGTVVDDRGLPVVGAKVAAYRNRTVSPSVEVQGIDSSAAAETDANGYFVLSGIEGQVASVRAWAAELAAQTVPDVQVGTGNVTIRLTRLARITGVLLDADGRPLEGSQVAARSVGAGAPVVRGLPLDDLGFGPGSGTQTDAEGRFTIPRVRPGTVSLSAEGARHLPVEGYTVQAAPGATVENVVLRAEIGAGIDAQVVDAAGQPVAGATVVVSERPDPRADAAGPPGARRFAMRVGGGDGGPDGGVRVLPSDGPRQLRQGKTDADGRVRLGGLPAGPVQVRAESPSHAPSRGIDLDVPRRGVVDAVLTVRPGGHVSIKTVTATGEVAPEVHFVLRGPDGAAQGDAHVERGTTDAAGIARVGPLLEGRYAVVLELGPRPQQLGGGMNFVIAGAGGDELAETKTDVAVHAGEIAEIVLQRPTLATVRGTVTDATGPARGVEVRLSTEDTGPFASGPSSTTDASGAFVIEDVRSGSYRLEWGRQDQVVKHEDTLDVPPGVSEVRRDLELHGGAVRVEVRSSIDGLPLDRADVSLRRAGDQPRRQTRGIMMVRTAISTDGQGSDSASSITMGGTPKVQTGDDGVAVIEDVPPGEYVLVIEHRKHSDGRKDAVQVIDGRVTDVGSMTLAAGGTVRGKVVGFPEGAEMRIALVEVRRVGSDAEPRRETAMEGAFQIDRLESGDYELRAQRVGPGAGEEFGPWRKVTVVAGEAARVELPLSGS